MIYTALIAGRFPVIKYTSSFQPALRIQQSTKSFPIEFDTTRRKYILHLHR